MYILNMFTNFNMFIGSHISFFGYYVIETFYNFVVNFITGEFKHPSVALKLIQVGIQLLLSKVLIQNIL